LRINILVEIAVFSHPAQFMKNNFPIQILTIAALATIAITGCKVKTSTEAVPEAEGSGKKAINIRVEPMTRQEMKKAADTAIDKTAEAAGELKQAATTAAGNLKVMATNITTMTSTMINIHKANEARKADEQTSSQ
jgi:hypothetical protein